MPEVLVIDENDQKLGIMRTRPALDMARQRNFDLVEVAPNAQPPVCRFMDYGKYRYEQTKRERDAHKTQKVVIVKELRLRPKIGDHDLETKSKQARGFLEDGHKVKMTVLFKGRENLHQDIGRQVLQEVIDALKDVATIEQAPRSEGRNMTMVLTKNLSAQPKPNLAASPPRPQPPRPSPSPSNGAVSADNNRPSESNGNSAKEVKPDENRANDDSPVPPPASEDNPAPADTAPAV